MNLVQIEKLKYWMVQMALAPPGTSKYATPATLISCRFFAARATPICCSQGGSRRRPGA